MQFIINHQMMILLFQICVGSAVNCVAAQSVVS